MTLKELISELTIIAQEKPSWLDEHVYCQIGNDITYIDEINFHMDDYTTMQIRKIVLS